MDISVPLLQFSIVPNIFLKEETMSIKLCRCSSFEVLGFRRDLSMPTLHTCTVSFSFEATPFQCLMRAPHPEQNPDQKSCNPETQRPYRSSSPSPNP